MLLGAVWIFYPEFTACAIDSGWCSVAYWATLSAGKTGTLLIVFFASVVYAARQSSPKRKAKIFTQLFLVLGGLLAGFAFLNEHVVKPVVKLSRPSHSYMIKQTKSIMTLDSLYTLEESQRKAYLKGLITSDTLYLKQIDQRVLNHWVDEAGFSFPSGHSFNAYLLGTILAFGIYEEKQRKWRLLALMPLSWALLVALSRVALGAHTAADVSAGAGIGLLLAFTLLGITATRKLLVPKTI